MTIMRPRKNKTSKKRIKKKTAVSMATGWLTTDEEEIQRRRFTLNGRKTDGKNNSV